MRQRLGLAVLALVTSVSCGDAADDGGFRGDPLDELVVDVSYAVDASLVEGRTPRVSFAWVLDDAGAALEQESLGVALAAELPSSVAFGLLENPPDAALRTDPLVTGRFALGQSFVYDDADGDGRWNAKLETVLAADTALIVLYAPDGVSGKTIGDYGKGFHHVAPAACPEALRFTGPAAGHGTLAISKATVLFTLTCPEPPGSICAPFIHTRYFCRLDPTNLFCTDCAAAVFPDGADASACSTWLDACEKAYPNDLDECESEYAVCAAGEPTCDSKCRCQWLLDDCLTKSEADVCHAKLDWCLGNGS